MRTETLTSKIEPAQAICSLLPGGASAGPARQGLKRAKFTRKSERFSASHRGKKKRQRALFRGPRGSPELLAARWVAVVTSFPRLAISFLLPREARGRATGLRSSRGHEGHRPHRKLHQPQPRGGSSQHVRGHGGRRGDARVRSRPHRRGRTTSSSKRARTVCASLETDLCGVGPALRERTAMAPDQTAELAEERAAARGGSA